MSKIKITQENINFNNVVLKNVDPAIMTIDPNNNDGVKHAQEVHAINNARKDPEHAWRNELADLERQLAGAWTEKEARQAAETTIRQHTDVVYKLEDAIKELRQLLATPHLRVHTRWNGEIRSVRSSSEEKIAGSGALCGCDGCTLLAKIEKLDDALVTAKKQRETAIRKTGASIKSSIERDKLRPRYRELAQRAYEVDQATSKIRAVDGVGGLLGQERITRADRLGYTGLKPL